MSPRLWRCLLCLLPAAAPAAAPAQERAVTQRQGQAAMTLTGPKVQGGKLEARLSDELQLGLSVEGARGLQVELPEKLTGPELWYVSPRGGASVEPAGEGRVRWAQSFTVEPLQKGDHPFQLEPLRYREGDGPWQRVEWKPVGVVVTTQVAKADPAEVRDITSIEELPPEESWPLWLVSLVAIPPAVGVGLVVWLLLRGRVPAALPLTPDRAALRELEALAAQRPANLQEAERFHTALSTVVRRYIEHRYRLPAGRRTTQEFLAAVSSSPHLPEAQQTLLRDFLERCDLAKFAPVAPSADECQGTLALARAFVEQTSSTNNTNQHE